MSETADGAPNVTQKLKTCVGAAITGSSLLSTTEDVRGFLKCSQPILIDNVEYQTHATKLPSSWTVKCIELSSDFRGETNFSAEIMFEMKITKTKTKKETNASTNLSHINNKAGEILNEVKSIASAANVDVKSAKPVRGAKKQTVDTNNEENKSKVTRSTQPPSLGDVTTPTTEVAGRKKTRVKEPLKTSSTSTPSGGATPGVASTDAQTSEPGQDQTLAEDASDAASDLPSIKKLEEARRVAKERVMQKIKADRERVEAEEKAKQDALVKKQERDQLKARELQERTLERVAQYHGQKELALQLKEEQRMEEIYKKQASAQWAQSEEHDRKVKKLRRDAQRRLKEFERREEIRQAQEEHKLQEKLKEKKRLVDISTTFVPISDQASKRHMQPNGGSRSDADFSDLSDNDDETYTSNNHSQQNRLPPTNLRAPPPQQGQPRANHRQRQQKHQQSDIVMHMPNDFRQQQQRHRQFSDARSYSREPLREEDEEADTAEEVDGDYDDGASAYDDKSTNARPQLDKPLRPHTTGSSSSNARSQHSHSHAYAHAHQSPMHHTIPPQQQHQHPSADDNSLHAADKERHVELVVGPRHAFDEHSYGYDGSPATSVIAQHQHPPHGQRHLQHPPAKSSAAIKLSPLPQLAQHTGGLAHSLSNSSHSHGHSQHNSPQKPPLSPFSAEAAANRRRELERSVQQWLQGEDETTTQAKATLLDNGQERQTKNQQRAQRDADSDDDWLRDDDDHQASSSKKNSYQSHKHHQKRPVALDNSSSDEDNGDMLPSSLRGGGGGGWQDGGYGRDSSKAPSSSSVHMKQAQQLMRSQQSVATRSHHQPSSHAPPSQRTQKDNQQTRNARESPRMDYNHHSSRDYVDTVDDDVDEGALSDITEVDSPRHHARRSLRKQATKLHPLPEVASATAASAQVMAMASKSFAAGRGSLQQQPPAQSLATDSQDSSHSSPHMRPHHSQSQSYQHQQQPPKKIKRRAFQPLPPIPIAPYNPVPSLG